MLRIQKQEATNPNSENAKKLDSVDDFEPKERTREWLGTNFYDTQYFRTVNGPAGNLETALKNKGFISGGFELFWIIDSGKSGEFYFVKSGAAKKPEKLEPIRAPLPVPPSGQSIGGTTFTRAPKKKRISTPNKVHSGDVFVPVHASGWICTPRPVYPGANPTGRGGQPKHGDLFVELEDELRAFAARILAQADGLKELDVKVTSSAEPGVNKFYVIESAKTAASNVRSVLRSAGVPVTININVDWEVPTSTLSTSDSMSIHVK